MEKQITTIPGYRAFEYLLVMNPHEELKKQVLEIKKEFAEKYKAPQALHSKNNISLVNFFAYQMTESRIINRIENIATSITPFKIELSGFGSFPTHCIYINVTTKVPIKELVKQLKLVTQLMTLNKDHKPHFIEESHLNICRKLKPWQYEQACLEYSHRHFSGRFIADCLTLLRRPAGEMKYESLMLFEFKDLAVDTKQGSLFM